MLQWIFLCYMMYKIFKWSLVSATVHKVILKFWTVLNWLNILESEKFFKHETYVKASQLESLKWLLAADLEQRNLVQLCHFSLLCPLQSMHVLQHFTNAWTPHEKKDPLAACVATFACLVHIFVGLDSLSNKGLLEWFRDLLITRSEVRQVWRMGETPECPWTLLLSHRQFVA